MAHVYQLQKLSSFLLPPMARLLLALGLLLSALAARAQAPVWQAASAITTSATGSAYSNAVATDAVGNVYVAGQFSGTVSLGSFSFTSPAGAGNNGFVAKWSPATRSFVWARQLGGVVSGIAVVGSNVYAAGYFFGTANFGNTTLTSAGDYDIFVVRMLDAGSSSSLAWVNQAGGTGADQARAVAASSTGIYVSGTFAQTATFGATALTASSSSSSFVTKLVDSNSSGVFSWVQTVISTNPSNAFGLATLGNAVYVSGIFRQAAQFGSIALTGGTGSTAYVAKLLDTGSTSAFSWVQAPGTQANDMYALGVAVAGSSIYVTGAFTGTATFGSQTLTAAGAHDLYVAKLTDGGSTGTFVWAQQAGGPDEELAQKVLVNGSSVYVTGSFRGTAIFGSTSLTSLGSGDIFVMRLTDTGPSTTFGWAQLAGGSGNDGGYALAMSGAMTVVVGSFNNTASFGTQAVTSTGLYSENAFLALLGPDVLATAPAAQVPSFVCYPNPTHSLATIQIPITSSPATLTLLDGLGRVARTASAPAGKDYPLDLTGLAPGVYALRVQTGEGQATQKLVVE